ncbi:MAG: hypothetical protein JWL59_4657 [Chthoniobacteraceae bacterium]|nr:hypothetical protein [Chthoniobacteraceae bacterium]
MNESSPYRVRIIVDPSFGDRLISLPTDEPVWIVQSPINSPVAQRLWAERRTSTHLAGITTFQPGSIDTPEDNFLSILDTVNLHHGESSAQPPYSGIEVIGCEASLRVRAALDDFSFHLVALQPGGFTASTPEVL